MVTLASRTRVTGASLGTTTGARLCPKDQPQQVRMPKVAELSQIAWPRRVAAAGAPHTAAVRFRELLVVVSCAQNSERPGLFNLASLFEAEQQRLGSARQPGRVKSKISLEIVPSETLVTGPVIKIEKSSPISMEIFP